MNSERNAKLLEEAIVQLKELASAHKEQLADFYDELREFRSRFETKLNSLFELQKKNKQEIGNLSNDVCRDRSSSEHENLS